MSGGYWDYKDEHLYNEIFHYGAKNNPLEDKELSLMLADMFKLLHDFDWYKSDDTCKEDYLKAKSEFKKKWIRNTNYRKDVLKKIIEDEFKEKKQELLEMIDQ